MSRSRSLVPYCHCTDHPQQKRSAIITTDDDEENDDDNNNNKNNNNNDDDSCNRDNNNNNDEISSGNNNNNVPNPLKRISTRLPTSIGVIGVVAIIMIMIIIMMVVLLLPIAATVTTTSYYIGDSIDSSATITDAAGPAQNNLDGSSRYSGPYQLVEKHVGSTFLDHYDFYVGTDSGGSAGYQTYVSRSRAEELGLIHVGGGGGDGGIADDDDDADDDNITKEEQHSFVTLSSSSSVVSNNNGISIESLRLEGKTRFDRGLLILDVDHVPNGCGAWPAFRITDESSWPGGGEIDILETFKGRRIAQRSMHTFGLYI